MRCAASLHCLPWQACQILDITPHCIKHPRKIVFDKRGRKRPRHAVPTKKRFMKRCFDFTVSLCAILMLSPLFALLALLIYFDSGGPVLFRQPRVGRGNKLFNIYKFRTMKTDAPSAVAKETLQDSGDYTTRIGRVLRRTSLDELPQLFNIVRGEMSVVGPRPLIPQETEIRRLRERYHVYSVRPGVTGLAQVNGRDALSIEQKARFDKEYVDNFSLWNDIKILFKTVVVVLKRDNAS